MAYREVYEGDCSSLVHELETANENVERLRREIVDKDDMASRLRGEVSSVSQALDQLQTQHTHTHSQLDAELDNKQLLQQR